MLLLARTLFLKPVVPTSRPRTWYKLVLGKTAHDTRAELLAGAETNPNGDVVLLQVAPDAVTVMLPIMPMPAWMTHS